jgi:hypothetical protein
MIEDAHPLRLGAVRRKVRTQQRLAHPGMLFDNFDAPISAALTIP